MQALAAELSGGSKAFKSSALAARLPFERACCQTVREAEAMLLGGIMPVPIPGMLPPGMLPPGMMPPSSMAMGGMAMSSMGMVMGAGPAWHAPYPLQEGLCGS